LPDQIPWGPVDARGATKGRRLFGDPTKPGFYMVYNKWTKGNHFQPPAIFHPNDRYNRRAAGNLVGIGSGPKFDPDKGTVPMPLAVSSPITAKQVH